MSKIVELCGSPGVGKSTIYNQIELKWKDSYKWIPAHYLYPSVKLDYSNVRSFLIASAKRILGKKDNIALQEAGNRFIAQYPQYIDALWNNIQYREKSSINGTDQRFEKAAYIYTLIQKIQFVREATCEKTAIVDEGLINGIGAALYKSHNEIEEKNEIENTLNQIPLPDAVIYIDGDLQENIKRFGSRKKIINSFKSLNEDELTNVIQKLRKTRKLAIDGLVNIGVPVLHVNSTTDSVSANASKIIAFVENLNCTINKKLNNPIFMDN